MTTLELRRLERQRIEAERRARAYQTMLHTIIALLALLLAFSLAGYVEGGTSDADLIEQEVNEWAARGVNIFE